MQSHPPWMRGDLGDGMAVVEMLVVHRRPVDIQLRRAAIVLKCVEVPDTSAQLSKDVSPKGVRVVQVSPGWFETDVAGVIITAYASIRPETQPGR